MIIPRLSLTTETTETIASQSTLIERIRHWSLFGKLALSGVEPTHIQSLVNIIESVGGFVDLQIELTAPTEQDALDLLNAGASSIVWPAAGQRPEEMLGENHLIPPSRLVFRLDSDSIDEAIPAGHVVTLSNPAADRIAELEMARIDCYIDAGTLDEQPEMIAEFLKTVLVTDHPDGLWATMIVDPLGVALGLAWSNDESLLYAIEHRCGVYWSRSRDGLWIKGESSGATQHLLGIRFDCDRDCLRFTVTQDPPGFCHRDTYTCFGEQRSIQSVIHRLTERINDTDEGSFTRKLANDPALLESKLLEEAQELSDAAHQDCPKEVAWEAADVLYFSLIAMIKNGVSLDQVYQELARRMNRVVRRPNKEKS